MQVDIEVFGSICFFHSFPMDGNVFPDKFPLAGVKQDLVLFQMGFNQPISFPFFFSFPFSKSSCNCLASSKVLMALYRILSSVNSPVVELGDTQYGVVNVKQE